MQRATTFPRPIAPHRSCGGMTLIELLVAVALLAIVASLAYRGLDTLARSSNVLIDDGRRWQDLALFFNRFGNDVAQPARRPLHTGAPRDSRSSKANTAANGNPNQRFAAMYSTALGAMAQRADYSNAPTLPAWQGLPLAALDAADESDRAALEFTRKSASGRDDLRLGYRLRGTQLELLLWPVLDRRTDSAPDAGARPAIHPLLDGVSALRFQHLDDGGNWLDHWPPQGAPDDMLPRAVAIELILQDGTRLRRVFALPA